MFFRTLLAIVACAAITLAAPIPAKDGIFIASGYGIRSGVKIPRVTNLDVAPTLAELLGVTLPEVEGRVLREILE